MFKYILYIITEMHTIFLRYSAFKTRKTKINTIIILNFNITTTI